MITSCGLVLTYLESFFNSILRAGVDSYALLLREGNMESSMDLGLIYWREL